MNITELRGLKMNKIIILDNILRYPEGHCFNTGWLYEIFGYIIKNVTNITVQSALANSNKSFYYEIYNALNIRDITKTSWIDIYNIENNEKTLSIVKKYFDNSLVIAYELHPFLQDAFNKLSIPYIKLMCHPVRFMDDIFFGITSSNRDVFNKLKKYQANEEDWGLEAAFIKAQTARKDFCNEIDLKPNSCVFFAQTVMDCSLLENNRMVSFFDYKDKFMKIYNQYEHLYYKIHPCENNKDYINFIKTLDRATILYPQDIATYDLIATDKIKKYFSISSGALYEARIFGKETEYFLKQPFMFINDYADENYQYENTYIPVYKNYWQPSFWADILEEFFPTRKYVVDVNGDFKNKLRSIINLSWGYKDINSVYFNNFENRVNKVLHKVQRKNAKIFFNFLKRRFNAK